jgi:hypothetical protein
MTTETIQKRVNLQVTGVAHVEGNRGPQWEITIKYPFSQYATKQWVDKDGDNTEPIVGETYPCIITRGEITTEKKTGEPYDGEKDWMWRWRITEWNTDSPAPAAQPAPQASTPSAGTAAPKTLPPDDYQLAEMRKTNGIERSVVFKAAVDIYVSMGSASTDNPEAIGLLAALAEDLWGVLQNIGQGATQHAPAAPESDVDAPPDAEEAEEVEDMPWDEPDVPWREGFRDLSAFGKWAKSHGFTSSQVVEIAKSIGLDVNASLELASYINDKKLIAEITERSQA